MEFTKQEYREIRAYCQYYPGDKQIKAAMQAELANLAGNPFPNVRLLTQTYEKLKIFTRYPAFIGGYELSARLISCMRQSNPGDLAQVQDCYTRTLDILVHTPYFTANPFPGIYPCASLAEGIYTLFENKALYLETLALLSGISLVQAAYMAIDALHTSRQYHIGEHAFASSAYVLLRRIAPMGNLKEVEEAIAYHLGEVRRICGIYDISRSDIDYFADAYARIEGDAACLKEQLAGYAGQFTAHQVALADVSAKAEQTLAQANKAAGDKLTAYARGLQEKLDASYKRFQGVVQQTLSEAGQVPAEKPSGALSLVTILKETVDSQHPPVPMVDLNVDLKAKIQRLLAQKKPGELYHRTFDTIAKLVLMDRPVLLVGPSGAGKTHAVQQLAELMGLKYYNLSYINEEYKLTGFKDANSNYDITSFYQAYKYGGLCFFDELDNSHPGAVLLLNEFLGTKKNASFIFPNREMVVRHRYFRLIAASNTWGNGADRIHNVRAKLDGATVNRFTAVAYGYDPQVERLLCQDGQLLTFLRAYRRALEALEIPQPLTYRDFEDMDTFLTDGLFTPTEAMELKLVRNTRVETLQKLYGIIQSQAAANRWPENPFLKSLGDIVDRRQKAL